MSHPALRARRFAPLFRHSRRDAVPFAVTLLQAALTVFLAAHWSALDTVERLAAVPLGIALAWYNPIIATHNFLHTPFFASEAANRVYAALNSINLGLPLTLYRFHHLNHHAHSNDRRGADGRTKDLGSTYAHGRHGQHEPVLSYCALSLFRPGTSAAWHAARRKGHGGQLAIELGACLLGIGLLAWWSPAFWLTWWLPTFYGGWFLAHLENYYEHVGAEPTQRLANSVSYYGRLYNALLCNEGYHQEHHLRPQAHWTERPRIRAEFAAALDHPARRIARVPPLLGFLDSRTR